MRFVNLSCLLFIIVLFPRVASGQLRKSKILQRELASGYGKVQLTDGSEEKGLVSFNDNDGIVTVQADEQSRSFNARNVSKFEFYNNVTFRTQLFYSIEFDDTDTGRKEPEIFEVLKEFDSFAVLSRFSRLEAKGPTTITGKRTSPLITNKNANPVTLEQIETVYFVDAQGTFEPYLKIIEREVARDLWDDNATRNKFVHSDLFEKYTGEHFKTLTEYAKKNNLSLKRKSHLIELLDEFERLNAR